MKSVTEAKGSDLRRVLTPSQIHVAAVTGASSGIGRAIALSLGAHGATVCLIGRRRRSLEDVRDSAGGMKKRLIVYEADLENDQELQRLAARLSSDHDGFDALVHSAGLILPGMMEAAHIEDFDRQFRVNVRAPYFLTQMLLPALRVRRGQVVFINSSAGLHAKAGIAGYSASKHALKAVADALRDEVGGDGIRVLSVFPGKTATRMQAEISRAEGLTPGPEGLMPPEGVAEVVIDVLRLNRKAEVTDIHIRPAHKMA